MYIEEQCGNQRFRACIGKGVIVRPWVCPNCRAALPAYCEGCFARENWACRACGHVGALYAFRRLGGSKRLLRRFASHPEYIEMALSRLLERHSERLLLEKLRKRRGPPVRKKRHVARHVINVQNVVRRVQLYAFLSSVEHHDDGGQTLVFQCTTREWIEKVWEQLEVVGVRARLLSILGTLNFTGDFHGSYKKLRPDDRNFLYQLHLFFLARVLQRGDESPVLTFDWAMGPQDLLLGQLGESRWFLLELENQPVLVGSPGYGALVEFGLDPSADRDLGRWWITAAGLVVVPETPPTTTIPPHRALRMLHFPQSPAPEPQAPQQSTGSPLDRDTTSVMVSGYHASAPHSPGSGPSAWLAHAAQAVSEGWRRFSDAIADWLGPLDGGPPLAPAGVPAGWSPPRPSPPSERCPSPRPAPMYYVGGSDGTAQGQPQVPNPMVRGAGAYQPFVGVIDVGQGNCNVLFDHAGRATVYYDFGYRKLGAHPAGGPPSVCLCHDPLIVLSHWDGDHILLARYNPRAYRCTWLAPQQYMGSVDTRELVARVVRAGGTFHLWEDLNGHMVFPWGFLVRARDPNAQNDEEGKNNTGLAIYACVRDDSVNRTTAAPGVAIASACTQLVGFTSDAQLDALATSLDLTAREVSDELKAAAVHGNVFRYARAAANEAKTNAAAAVVVALSMGVAMYLALQGPPHAYPPPLGQRRRIAELVVAALQAAPRDIDMAAVAGSLGHRHQGLPIVDAVTAVQTAMQAARLGGASTGTVQGAVTTAAIANVTFQIAQDVAQIALDTVGAHTFFATNRPRAQWSSENAAAAALNTDQGAVFHTLDSAIYYAEDVISAVVTHHGTAVEGVEAIAARAFRDDGEQRKIAAVLRDALAMSNAFNPARVALPPIRTNVASTHPPTDDTERFVLSTGDAMIQFVPSQAFVNRPLLVGVVACHHGSNEASGATMDPRHMPWAAGSLAARAVGLARGGPVASTMATVAAALALGTHGPAGELGIFVAAVGDALQQGASPFAALVAGAMEVVHRGHGTLLTTLRAIVETALGGGVNVATPAHTMVTATQVGGLALVNTLVYEAIAGIARDARFEPPDALANAVPALPNVAEVAADTVFPPAGLTTPRGNARVHDISTLVGPALVAQANWPRPSQVRAAMRAASGGVLSPHILDEYAQTFYALLVARAAEQQANLLTVARGLNATTVAATKVAVIGAGATLGRVMAGLANQHDLVAARATMGTLAHAHATVADEAHFAAQAPRVHADDDGRIVYPYGALNSYHHPMERAQRKWRAHGWTSEQATASAGRAKAIGWEIATDAFGATTYEGPLRGDAPPTQTLDRSVVCACGGVKTFDC
ncbi:hypothetical protein OV203_20045 [Nannocystis sp. ILAH1]|uniref:hypothetical protein n=1 Tax=unclassified Nannocystis TaxID=2627009 RepID=UPI002271CAB4|nr:MULTISPECIES: hypothetical protein [unclassified Nannocystis]MCY0989443.1 hypothetical protein [Nannocystis sp. ILAH1]MCY1064858.1 hypothetical protein [Nannocystis sp. RBIL2]